MKTTKELIVIVGAIAVAFIVMGCIHVGLALILSGRIDQVGWRFAVTSVLSFVVGAYCALYTLVWFRHRNWFTARQRIQYGALAIAAKSALAGFAFVVGLAKDEWVVAFVLCPVLAVCGYFVGADLERRWNAHGSAQ